MKKNIIITLFIALFITTNASAAIIFTESFEQPVETSYIGFTRVGIGQQVGAFDIVSNNVDLIGRYWQAADGIQSLDMNGSAPGIISYDLPTVSGTNYDVSFSLAGNPTENGIRTLNVTAELTSQLFSFDVANQTTTNMGWVTKHFYFTATGAVTALSFADIYSGSYRGAALDNIVVSTRGSEVPEPASLILMFSGIVGLLTAFRKKS